MDISKSELLVIVGMPGSGKTTYANRLMAEGALDGFCDDYEYGPINSFKPQIREKDEVLLKALRDGKRWAVADTRYCDPTERDKLELALVETFPGLLVRFVYFENNIELCEHNATIREGSFPRHQINLMYYYENLYTIPDGAEVIPIHKA